MRVLRISLLGLIVCSLFGQSAPDLPAEVAEVTPPRPADSSTPAAPSLGASLPAPQSSPQTASLLPPAPSPDGTRFRIVPALLESGFYIGVQHAWRLANERGTRDTLHGPFLHDYFNSVTSLRGWDDGDGFFTSYIGHPMEGAVFGFIQQQNDPRYQTVEFGDGRRYWMSRLRALPFSAAMSTLWTLGPASEASLGNVQLHASPGFVDLAGTPILGVGWMVGEDVIDRYLVSWVENRTANPVVLLLVRSFGNPTRSMAKLMQLKVPWARDTRPGLFAENHIMRAAYLKSLSEKPAFGEHAAFSYRSTFENSLPNQKETHDRPVEAPIELTATAHYEWFVHGGTCVGGGGTGSARISPDWQFVAEVAGCMIMGVSAPQSGDSLTYMIGPRWTPRAAHRWSPYAQFLIGGRRVTQEIPDPVKQQQLLDEWEAKQLPHYPMLSDYQSEVQRSGLAIAAGGGVDVLVNRALAIRVANLEYTRARISKVERLDPSQGLRFEAGMILRVGTW